MQMALSQTAKEQGLLLIAHRGLSALFPENTMAAFQAARTAGCEAIELDVQLSRDGAVVVFHDHDLLRLAGNTAQVASLTVEQLRGFDVGSWKSPIFANERIPTLREVLNLWGTQGLVNIELKSAHPENTALADAVAQVLAGESTSQILISSFDWDLLRYYRSLDAAMPIAVLFDHERWQEAFAVAAEIGAVAVNPDLMSVDEGAFQEALDRGLAIYVYTVNDADAAAAVARLGASGVFSDDAPALRLALESQR
jgi:glycerophosphoryl diester phosphodiesterase